MYEMMSAQQVFLLQTQHFLSSKESRGPACDRQEIWILAISKNHYAALSATDLFPGEYQ